MIRIFLVEDCLIVYPLFGSTLESERHSSLCQKRAQILETNSPFHLKVSAFCLSQRCLIGPVEKQTTTRPLPSSNNPFTCQTCQLRHQTVFRVLRKKWQKLDEKEKAKVRGTLWNFRGMLGLVAVAGVSALVINYFTHLQATPMTGRVRYLAFTNEQFRKIADYEFEMVSFQET